MISVVQQVKNENLIKRRMFNVLSIDNKQQWKRVVNKCGNYDFYHTWDYHQLSFQNNEGEPRLFVYEKNDKVICFPLLQRLVTDRTGNVAGVDYTSVYGYVGMISSNNVDEIDINSFSENFNQYLLSEGCISVFSRLHPTIDQEKIINRIGERELNSKTIQIDLTQSLAEQRKYYRKSNKSEINKLRKTAEVLWSNHSEEDIDEFIKIYNETMKRVNAKDYYFFNKQYYLSLINAEDYKTQLIFVVQNGVKIAGALFVFCKNIIQYHLAGTRTEYMKLTPMKLLLDEVRIYGTEKGFKILHLGGGTSVSEDDPLFRFKKGFSKIECEFSVFKKIIDKQKYNQLVKEKSNVSDLNPHFFPLYRA